MAGAAAAPSPTPSFPHAPTRSGYAIDITLPGERIAIEADGPTHTSRTGGGARPLGATAMKARHLAALGWRVINIPWAAWAALGGDAARQQHLAARLQQARGSDGQAAGGGMQA